MIIFYYRPKGRRWIYDKLSVLLIRILGSVSSKTDPDPTPNPTKNLINTNFFYVFLYKKIIAPKDYMICHLWAYYLDVKTNFFTIFFYYFIYGSDLGRADTSGGDGQRIYTWISGKLFTNLLFIEWFSILFVVVVVYIRVVTLQIYIFLLFKAFSFFFIQVLVFISWV